MKQTMLLKLTPTPEQSAALLETMHQFNAACTYVADVAFAEKTANKFALQKLVYGELRGTYKLAAQLAIRAISKASEAYKRDKSIKLYGYDSSHPYYGRGGRCLRRAGHVL